MTALPLWRKIEIEGPSRPGDDSCPGGHDDAQDRG